MGEIPDLYEGAGREGCDSQEGGAEKGNAEALNDRERRHSEVGAPARQDLGSLRFWAKEHVQTPRGKNL